MKLLKLKAFDKNVQIRSFKIWLFRDW